MKIKSCKSCKKLFQYEGGKMICPHCKKEEEEMFVKVKEYLSDNKRATLKQIHDDVKVPIKLIEEFLKSGRLLLSESSPIAMTCELCGEPILGGKLCDKCQEKQQKDSEKIGKALEEQQQKDALAKALAKENVNRMFTKK